MGSSPRDFKKSSDGFMVAESKITLLSLSVEARKTFPGSALTIVRAEADLVRMLLSSLTEAKRALRNLPTLKVESGGSAPVEMECQAAFAHAVSSRARLGSYASFSFRLTYLTNNSLLRCHPSCMLQNSLVL